MVDEYLGVILMIRFDKIIDFGWKKIRSTGYFSRVFSGFLSVILKVYQHLRRSEKRSASASVSRGKL